MSNGTQVHPKFNAADADISILSSDGVLFRIHSINLKVNSTAFPTEITSNPNDPATFSESSNILELLFAFLYPTPPHPALTDLSFDVFQTLAYAAHKYSITSAISVCNIMMIDSAKNRDKHPLTLLEYACHYMIDQEKRLEDTAIVTLQCEAVHALKILDREVFAAWVIYRDRWRADGEEEGKDFRKHSLVQWAAKQNRGIVDPESPKFKECLAVARKTHSL